MFKRDKHLQTESALSPLCCITGVGVGEGKGLVTDRWTELSMTRKMLTKALRYMNGWLQRVN